MIRSCGDAREAHHPNELDGLVGPEQETWFVANHWGRHQPATQEGRIVDYETYQSEHPATSSHDGNRAGCGPSVEVVDECVCRLERLTRHVDGFLGRQLAKIDEACGDLTEQAGDYAALEQKARELRDQQILWEQSKQQQKERIAEEVEMLTAAWDRIEADRRMSLADADSRPAAQSDVVVAAVPVASGEAMSEQQSPNLPDPGVSNANLSNPADYFDFDSAAAGRSAALQFQQIKREIRQHARRGPS